MEKLLKINFKKSGNDGNCEMLKKMDEISDSLYKPGYEGFHYYFFSIKEALAGKDIVDVETGQKSIAIRRVGRSCGSVRIDKNDRIIDSYFCEEIGQDKEMMEIMKKYIGYKIVL